MGERSVANPLGDNAPTSAAASDLAQALRGLKDGSLSELETVRALEQHFEEKYRLRPRLEDAMGSFFSHLTAAPANWHQCTIWCLGSPHAEDAALRQRGPWLYAVSCAMVLLQTATVAGLFMGTVSKSCMTNDDCDRGLFCATGWTGRCDGCGDRPPFVFEVEGRVLVSPADDPAFPGWNLTAVNAVCASPTGHATVSAGGSIIQYDSHTTSSWCAACVSMPQGGRAPAEEDEDEDEDEERGAKVQKVQKEEEEVVVVVFICKNRGGSAQHATRATPTRISHGDR